MFYTDGVWGISFSNKFKSAEIFLKKAQEAWHGETGSHKAKTYFHLVSGISTQELQIRLMLLLAVL